MDLDEKFERRLKEKQDIEQAKVLKELSLHLKESDISNSKILQIIDRQTNELSLFLKKELPSPKVIVENKNDEILKVFKKIEETQLMIIENQKNLLSSQSNKPKRLKVVRNRINNTIDYIDIEWNN